MIFSCFTEYTCLPLREPSPWHLSIIFAGGYNERTTSGQVPLETIPNATDIKNNHKYLSMAWMYKALLGLVSNLEKKRKGEEEENTVRCLQIQLAALKACGYSRQEAAWVPRRCGWSHNCDPWEEGNESRGSGALTSWLVLSRFQRKIPKSHEVAHCLEQNLTHYHPGFPKWSLKPCSYTDGRWFILRQVLPKAPCPHRPAPVPGEAAKEGNN